MLQSRSSWPERVDYKKLARDPFEVFRCISAVNSVSFAEDRMYAMLLQYWHGLAAECDSAVRAKLTIQRVGSCQLMVNWRGAPRRSRRRLILMAHTDREGFLCSKPEKDGRAVLFRGKPAGGGLPEAACEGSDVSLTVGRGGTARRCAGRVLGIDPNPELGEVIIQTEELSSADSERLLGLEPHDVVTANYAFRYEGSFGGLMSHALDKRTGFISADCVDNFAGISVTTSLLTAAVKDQFDCNVSALYSIGEEAAMLGVLDLVAVGTFFADDWDNTIIVIDASDVQEAYPCTLEGWNRVRILESRLDGGSAAFGDEGISSSRAQNCPDDMAVVRSEDRAVLYDLTVTRFLFQAYMGGLEILKQLLRETPLLRQDLGKFTARGWPEDCPARIGMFQGGLCEAALVSLAPELAKALVAREGVRRPRVGAIAIPLTNYRNLVGDRRLAPERTHYRALLSAYAIARGACQLHTHYHFSGSTEPRYRGGEFPRMSKTLDVLCRKLEMFWKDRATIQRLAGLRGWIEAQNLEA